MNTRRNTGTLPKRPKFDIAVDEEKKKPPKKTVTKKQTGSKSNQIKSNTENVTLNRTTGAIPKSITAKPRKALADLPQDTNVRITKRRSSATSQTNSTVSKNQSDILVPKIEKSLCSDKLIEENAICKKDSTSLYRAIQKRPRKASHSQLQTIKEIVTETQLNINKSDSSTEDVDFSLPMLCDNINYEKLKQSVNIVPTRGNYSDNRDQDQSDISFSILGDDFNYERLRQCLKINTVRGNYTQLSSDEDDEFQNCIQFFE